MELLQPRASLLRHCRTASAEAMQLLHLAEKLQGIVYVIDAELQRAHIVAVDGNRGRLAWQIGALAGEREEGFFVILLLRAKRQNQVEAEQRCDNGALRPHQSAPRKMFQRYTPR